MRLLTSSENELPTVSAEEMRQVDKLMIDTYHIELLQMMENAGRNLADLTAKALQENISLKKPATITILVGPGGNGGGGLVAARHLHNRGYRVHIICATPLADLMPVTAHQATIVKALGITLKEKLILPPCDLILDCLLGYSLTGNPREPFTTLITKANNSNLPIIALDTPSGLDVTTGKPQNPCMKATATMTLALPKSGFLIPSAQLHLGALYLADISVPPTLYQQHLNLKIPTNIFSIEQIIKLIPVE